MKASLLYLQLEKDFITSAMSDEWAQDMKTNMTFLSENFKKRSMGLVCDFTSEIKKVFTAVFPSQDVMQRVLDTGIQDAMLFVHHPMIWDIRKAPKVFQEIDEEVLRQYKNKQISIYNLHVPLDNYGEYSTSVTLARALGLKPEKPFAPYFGALAGVFCSANAATLNSLRNRFEKAVGHSVSLYNYGSKNIRDGIIAVVAGGGLTETIEEIAEHNINTFVTGITAKNEHSIKAHEFAEKHKINVLGGTHYSTEKFACIAMTDYFKKIGLASEFIADKPVMEDM